MEMRIVDLGVRLGGRHVLRGVDFVLDAGVTALVGRNGAGKTTLLRAMTGFLRPDSGSVLFDGASIHDDPSAEHGLKRSLGWVPQQIDLPQSSIAGEFVRFCAWLGGIDGNATAAMEVAFAAVQLEEESRMKIGKLSGGQQRRVMVAAALVTDPSIILFDEPTVGMDPQQRRQFHRIVSEAGRNRRVLISTHLMEDVLGVADRVILLSGGRIKRVMCRDDIREAVSQGSTDPYETLSELLFSESA